MRPFFIGKQNSREWTEYYRECRRLNKSAITIRPKRVYGVLSLDYFPTSDDKGAFREMSEEQEKEMLKVVEKYEKFMQKGSWLTWGRHHLRARVKLGAAELMAMELRGIMDDHRTSNT